MSTEGYHPARSQVSEDRLINFLRSDIKEDILSIPGIGPKSKDVLASHNICTTYQLIGKYLSLKGIGVTPIEHADRFWYFLKGIGTANGTRAGVVRCIAEKLNLFIPDIYQGDDYEHLL